MDPSTSQAPPRSPSPRPDTSATRPLRRQIADGVLVMTLALALLALVGAFGAWRDIPFAVFAKEPVEQAHLRPYVGFLAHITWFLWVVAGTSGVLAAIELRRRHLDPHRVRFFGWTVLLTGLLLFDDFTMLHDGVFPDLNIPQETLYAAYAAFLLVMLVRYRREFLPGGILLALMAGAFWAFSLAFDSIGELYEIQVHVVEDGAKLLGTSFWAAFMVRSGLYSLRSVQCATDEATTRDPANDNTAAG